MGDAEVRSAARDLLQANKGSAGLHEWLLSLLEAPTVPRTLAAIVDLVSAHVTAGAELTTRTL